MTNKPQKTNVRLVAVVSEEAAQAAEVPDVQALLEEQLAQRYEFLRLRFQTALYYSVAATAGVILALIVVSALNLLNIRRLPETYQFYESFLEWRTEGAMQYPVCAWSCEIITQSTRLLGAAKDIGASVISSDGQGNVAGMARLCTLISVLFAVWFAYRKQLPTRYSLNGQEAQREDFEQMPRWQFWFNRVLYTVATLFGTYVVTSIVWLGLSLVFKDMTMGWFRAALVIIAFTATMTLAATYGALAVSTRDVLLLGLFTYAAGFATSFALAPPTLERQWWQVAVSNAGQFNPSASLFTGTLLSGSLTLVVLWFDVDSIIRKMVDDGEVRLLSADGWMWVARALYAVLVLGLLSVGFIRVDEVNHPFNTAFHAGGAVFAIISVIVSGVLIRKRRFHPWYKIFSVHILLGLTIFMSLFGSIKLNPPSWVFVGTGIISLTVIELALFILIGLWVYITVDNLLGQANINAFEGQVLVMARRVTPEETPPSE
ncbi:MAG: hypothetical protein K8L99_16990 [Anaerolineae bacterium]|nr:hypothetical protein [Anaerolineae bacterium]